jgi:hypothetical protein
MGDAKGTAKAARQEDEIIASLQMASIYCPFSQARTIASLRIPFRNISYER